MKKIKNNSKKKRINKKQEKKKETKLEEEIKKAEKAITHRLREIQNNEEKEIEQDSESKQEFFEEPIRQLPISSSSNAPVLERIIEREIPNPIIEQPIQAREETNERRIEYSPTKDTNYNSERIVEGEEKNYESVFVPPVLSRREESNTVRPEFLKPQSEAWTQVRRDDNQFIESEFIEEERKLPFEEQKKYKRTKL